MPISDFLTQLDSLPRFDGRATQPLGKSSPHADVPYREVLARTLRRPALEDKSAAPQPDQRETSNATPPQTDKAAAANKPEAEQKPTDDRAAANIAPDTKPEPATKSSTGEPAKDKTSEQTKAATTENSQSADEANSQQPEVVAPPVVPVSQTDGLVPPANIEIGTADGKKQEAATNNSTANNSDETADVKPPQHLFAPAAQQQSKNNGQQAESSQQGQPTQLPAQTSVDPPAQNATAKLPTTDADEAPVTNDSRGDDSAGPTTTAPTDFQPIPANQPPSQPDDSSTTAPQSDDNSQVSPQQIETAGTVTSPAANTNPASTNKSNTSQNPVRPAGNGQSEAVQRVDGGVLPVAAQTASPVATDKVAEKTPEVATATPVPPQGESAERKPAVDSEPNALSLAAESEPKTTSANATDKVRPPVNPQEFVERLADAVRQAHQNGGQLKVRLQPPELGIVQIEVTMRDGVLTAKLDVDTPAAQQAINEHLALLRDALSQGNTPVERFEVQLVDSDQLREEFTSNQNQHEDESPNQGQQQQQNHSQQDENDDGTAETILHPAAELTNQIMDRLDIAI